MLKEIWLIFTVLFLILLCFHVYRSTQKIEKMPRIKGVKAINGLTTGLVEFQDGLDSYVDQLNNDNRRMNLITAFGYFVTAGTAIFSYFLV